MKDPMSLRQYTIYLILYVTTESLSPKPSSLNSSHTTFIMSLERRGVLGFWRLGFRYTRVLGITRLPTALAPPFLTGPYP